MSDAYVAAFPTVLLDDDSDLPPECHDHDLPSRAVVLGIGIFLQVVLTLASLTSLAAMAYIAFEARRAKREYAYDVMDEEEEEERRAYLQQQMQFRNSSVSVHAITRLPSQMSDPAHTEVDHEPTDDDGNDGGDGDGPEGSHGHKGSTDSTASLGQRPPKRSSLNSRKSSVTSMADLYTVFPAEAQLPQPGKSRRISVINEPIREEADVEMAPYAVLPTVMSSPTISRGAHRHYKRPSAGFPHHPSLEERKRSSLLVPPSRTKITRSESQRMADRMFKALALGESIEEDVMDDLPPRYVPPRKRKHSHHSASVTAIAAGEGTGARRASKFGSFNDGKPTSPEVHPRMLRRSSSAENTPRNSVDMLTVFAERQARLSISEEPTDGSIAPPPSAAIPVDEGSAEQTFGSLPGEALKTRFQNETSMSWPRNDAERHRDSADSGTPSAIRRAKTAVAGKVAKWTEKEGAVAKGENKRRRRKISRHLRFLDEVIKQHERGRSGSASSAASTDTVREPPGQSQQQKQQQQARKRRDSFVMTFTDADNMLNPNEYLRLDSNSANLSDASAAYSDV